MTRSEVDDRAEARVRKVRDAAAEVGVPTTIHLSESPFEVEIIRKTLGGTSTDLLEELGALADVARLWYPRVLYLRLQRILECLEAIRRHGLEAG